MPAKKFEFWHHRLISYFVAWILNDGHLGTSVNEILKSEDICNAFGFSWPFSFVDLDLKADQKRGSVFSGKRFLVRIDCTCAPPLTRFFYKTVIYLTRAFFDA